MSHIQAAQCVILAGGKSSRMGENKALLPFGGEKSLLAYQYKKMSKIFQNVFISCKEESNFDLDASYLYEKSDIFSPLVGIENAFKTLGFSKLFFLSVDTPFLTPVTIKRLCNVEDGYDIVYPQVQGISHYLVSLWDKRVLEILSQAIGNNAFKVGELFLRLHSLCIEFPHSNEFSNLNTPQDYQNALAFLRKQNG